MNPQPDFDEAALHEILAPLGVVVRILNPGEMAFEPGVEEGRRVILEEWGEHSRTEGGDMRVAIASLLQKLEVHKAQHPNPTTIWTRGIQATSISIANNGSPQPETMVSFSGAFGYNADDEHALNPMRELVETKQHVDFGIAIRALKQGYRVQRAVGWNGKGMFLYFVPASKFQANRAPLNGIFPEGTPIEYQPHIDMFNAQGVCVPWAPSQSDTLAEDWVILPRKV